MASTLMEHGSRKQKVQVRISSDLKETLEYAASLRGISLSDLLVNTAYETATATIRDHNILELSYRDSERFAQAMLEVTENSDTFKKGAARYADMVKR